MAKPTQNPERDALRSAIAAADAAAKSLQEAQTASENAQSHLSTAWSEQERLQELERTKCAVAQSRDHVIAAMAGGDDVGVVELDPHAELKKQRADVETKIRKWRSLRDFAQQEIETREVMLQQAQLNVSRTAAAVVAASVDVGKLLEETVAAQDIVIANRARLRQLLGLAPDGPDRERVRAFLGIGWLSVDWEYHPATQAARDFHAALCRDADAVA